MLDNKLKKYDFLNFVASLLIIWRWFAQSFGSTVITCSFRKNRCEVMTTMIASKVFSLWQQVLQDVYLPIWSCRHNNKNGWIDFPDSMGVSSCSIDIDRYVKGCFSQLKDVFRDFSHSMYYILFNCCWLLCQRVFFPNQRMFFSGWRKWGWGVKQGTTRMMGKRSD